MVGRGRGDRHEQATNLEKRQELARQSERETDRAVLGVSYLTTVN